MVKKISRLAFVFFLLLPFGMRAQQQNLCSGSLGENIFTEGDFGSGTSNIGFLDQSGGVIAPGYIFTNRPPPEDGYFTITNNTGWPNTFPSWIAVEDNSPDPNGYMMVVNADFDPGIFYRNRITGLCENTTYEFSVDIINLISPGVGGHIFPRVSFFLDGEQKFSSGNIPQDGNWNTYGFTFTTPPGTTEMELSLVNDAPGGIGNDIAMDNISFRACGPSSFVNTDQNIFLCEDDNAPQFLTADVDSSFLVQWQLSRDGGQNWGDISGATGRQITHNNFQVGRYQYRYLSATSQASLENLKCRYVSDVVSIEVLPLEYNFTDTICEGVPYELDGQLLTQSGTYFAALQSSRGCDSLVTIQLTVVPDALAFTAEAEPPACPGDQQGIIRIDARGASGFPLQYRLDGQLREGPVFEGLGEGTYVVELRDRYGCREVDTVDLSIRENFAIDAGPDVYLDFGEISPAKRIFANRELGALLWEPSTFLECGNCTETRIQGVENQTILVRAENRGGCQAVDSFQVIIENDAIRIYVPEAFSPNADGANDRFGMFGFAETIQEIRAFRIFDRWGGLLVDRRDLLPTEPEAFWDGSARGKRMNPGEYVYVFELILLGGSPFRLSGSVTLMR